jgi:hypothetical protein
MSEDGDGMGWTKETHEYARVIASATEPTGYLKIDSVIDEVPKQMVLAFRVGSIVRCEEREFESGKKGLVAMRQLITRRWIVECIDQYLDGTITTRLFGHWMFAYLGYEWKFEFEAGYDGLIKEVLGEFMDMHDAGEEYSGYKPYIPTREKMVELKELLK